MFAFPLTPDLSSPIQNSKSNIASGHASQGCAGFQSRVSSCRIQNPAEGGSSYGQILRSSSIIGGATGINYVIGMVIPKLDISCRPAIFPS